MSAAASARTPLSAYQKRLLVFLSVATFFEGYDFFALAQILPELRRDMALSEEQGSMLATVITFGTVAAYFLVRKADVWGRRRVMTLTIAGYTLASLMTGFAPNAIVFAICQFLARIFLIGEWAVAMVYAAEEFPKERRGSVLGVIQSCASLGAISCAGLVPLLLKTAYGWRSVYFVGAIPLLIVAYARRDLKETSRFIEKKAELQALAPAMARIWKTPYKKRVLQIALLWALCYVCTQNTTLFWKEFAVAERSFSKSQVGLSMTIAAVGSMPLIFSSGKLLDGLGRKRGGTVIFMLSALGVYLAYSAHSLWLLTLGLVFAIFGATATLPVLNAFTTELFPTDLRSDAYAWANNLIARTIAALSHTVIGFSAARMGWGPSVAFTSLFLIATIVLIWLMLPETQGRELEETSKL